MATTTTRRASNRFCPPVQRQPHDQVKGGSHRDAGMGFFADSAWISTKICLETRGWSPMQIELIHAHLRQGWPLIMAARQAALVTGLCPLRSKPLG